MNRSMKSVAVAVTLGILCMSVSTDSEARRRWGRSWGGSKHHSSPSHSTPSPSPRHVDPVPQGKVAPPVINQYHNNGGGFLAPAIGGAVGASMYSDRHRHDDPPYQPPLPAAPPNTVPPAPQGQECIQEGVFNCPPFSM